METTILPMSDGVRVVVPDKITQITSYVLAEQQDWFEDEIRFVRRMLRPGQTCIDIGAGLGVYSLSMAQRVGPTGCIVAFEPFTANADLIAQSIQLNQLGWIRLDRRAISERTGVAAMVLTPHSESNSVYRPERDGSRATTPILVTSLDEWLAGSSVATVDFIKIDAEGEEAAIIRGARKLLCDHSPIVLYEIRSRATQDMTLAESLVALGYESYRLVPGLNVLVPLDAKTGVDEFVLNLFACKSDTADRLAAEGLLIRASQLDETEKQEMLTLATQPGPHDYRQWLSKLPYAEALLKEWKKTVSIGKSDSVIQAINLYGISRDVLRSSVERYLGLSMAFGIFGKLCERQQVEYARTASLGRIALELGNRSTALNSIAKLMHGYHTNRRVDVSEPFLAPCARYDFLRPRDAIGSWVVASATEAFEYARHYSSFYAGEDSVQRLESIRDLGYATEATMRRLSLYHRLQLEKKKTNC